MAAIAICCPRATRSTRAILEAKERGLQYLVVTYLQKAERGGLDVYRRVASQLDKAGEACRKAGHHARLSRALVRVRADVRAPLEVLLKETSPSHLSLELDTFWASIAGHDPVAVPTAHKGTSAARPPEGQGQDTPVSFDETKAPKDAFKEVGNGVIDYAAFFSRVCGRRPVLQRREDYCLGSTPLDSLRRSYANIQKLTAGRS